MEFETSLSRPKIKVLVSFMLVAALMRIFPFPPNFTPIGAMALFGGAYFVDKRMAYLLPLVVMLFSDAVLELLFQLNLRPFSGFHTQMIGVYIGFLGSVFIGSFLKDKVNSLTVTTAALLGAIWFFVVSNFNVWLASGFYAYNISGLTLCYTEAIPFLQNTVLGDLFYCTILFGAFEALKYRFPKLALAN